MIAKRYAKALVELAEGQNLAENAKQDLVAFIQAMDGQPAVERLFRNPAITPEDKKAVIREIAQRLGLKPLTTRFMEFLAENNRVRYIRDVQQAYEDLLAERQNRVSVEVVSASPLNNGYVSDIKKRFEVVTGKNVDIKSLVDPALIGGVRARIGSVIYDGTIKNQLDKMRERMAK